MDGLLYILVSNRERCIDGRKEMIVAVCSISEAIQVVDRQDEVEDSCSPFPLFSSRDQFDLLFRVLII
jgi:hypothetical protein